MAAEPIFDNEKFKIGNKTFHYKNCSSKRIFRVKDLLDDKGNFFSHMQFVEKYQINIIFLDYLSCTKSIETYIKQMNIKLQNNGSNEKHKALQTIINVTKGSRKYYDILIQKIEILNIKAFMKWEEKLRTAIDGNKVCYKIQKIQEIRLKINGFK